MIVLISFINFKKDDSGWELMDSKKSIPKTFFSALGKNNDTFKIAGFDEKWNYCISVIDFSLPTKKILYIRKKINMWRVVYMKGGYGINYSYNEFQIKNDFTYNLKAATSLYKIDNNKMVKYFLYDKDIELIKIDIK